ncbi:MAG: flagellar hook-basal body complex protein FliE [Myxococcota bacterium]
MSSAIPPIGSELSLAPPESLERPTPSSENEPLFTFEGPAETGFGDLLGELVDDAARRGHRAGQMNRDFAAGRLDDLHGTMIANQQAGISNKLVGSIRTKLLESFQELWRINV